MKAAVWHFQINSKGGRVRVALSTIKLLKEMGFTVELVTGEKPEFETIRSQFGCEIKIDNVVKLFSFKHRDMAIYQGAIQRILNTIISSLRLRDLDFLIDTYGEVVPYYLPSGTKYIVYMHFPSATLALRETTTRYGNFRLRNAFSTQYMYFWERRLHRALRRAIVLTNSTFSSTAIKNIWPDIEPTIVYPPVDVNRFFKALRSDRREDKILIVSRFAPSKKLEDAIAFALMLPENIKVCIIGALVPHEQSYVEHLFNLIKKYGLDRRIEIKINASFNELIDSMASSKAYLHTMVGEHFGISIVEAMAAGLITIVPEYGGPAEYVPAQYQYSTLQKAAEIAIDAMNATQSSRDQLNHIAQRFSETAFKHKMRTIIENANSAR